MSGTVSTTRPTLRVLVDSAELLADVLATVCADEAITSDLFEGSIGSVPAHPGPTLFAVVGAPPIDVLLALGRSNRRGEPLALLCVIDDPEGLAELGPALSVPVYRRLGPALAAARWVAATSGFDPSMNSRGLGVLDRRRLPRSSDRGPRVVRLDAGILGVVADTVEHRLGRVDDLTDALATLSGTSLRDPPSLPRVEGADRETSLDVLVGPSRTLSDPASKAALEPYDLPLPIEELCATASRAAAESQRIGFPVRIALASPDLRASAHPELVVEGVEGGARVRECFRELVALAERTDPNARILGVTVGASTLARGFVRVALERRARDLLVATIGFADPHGRASDDSVRVPLPADPARVRDAILRLRGASLFADEGRADAGVVHAITAMVLRCAAFLHAFAEEVDTLSLDPVALLEGGEIEIREASVHVTDAFTRRLEPVGRPQTPA